MIVKDLMTTDPVSVRTNTSVKAALALLDEHHITMLPVVTTGGRVCGVVSEADLIRDLVDRDPRLMIPPGEHTIDRPQCVGDVMTTHAVTVGEHTDLADAVELATSTTVKSLPVVDDHDRLVGIVSRSDVVHMLARSDDLLEQELDALLVDAGLRDCLVDVRDGVAEITGPADHHERILATVLARAVPGVVEVHVV
jgi:CBS-domain-containing membrane protein